MRTLLLVAFSQLLFTTSLKAQTKDEVAVRAVLAEQEKAWNKGDMDAFMTGYWQSDSLLFIGKAGISNGWQNTLHNYKKSYPDTASMGQLKMEVIQLKRLSVMYFFVAGRWFLSRSDGNLSGSFTLLFKKIKNRWVIVADHSS